MGTDDSFQAELDAAAAKAIEKTVNETPAEQLASLVELSMQRARALLLRDDDNAGLMRTQAALINTFMTSAIRVQENLLRQRKKNAVERLTKLLHEERERQRQLGY